MCKRTSKDRLLQTFLQDYGLNLLQVPREGATVGEVYAVLGERVLPPGGIGGLLEPSPRLPASREERLSHLAGTVSDAVSSDVGLSLLAGFLAAVTGGALVGQIHARHHLASVGQLTFRIEDATRESVDTAKLWRALTGCRLQPSGPLTGKRYRHYVTVGVVRTSSITVRAKTAEGQAADLEASTLLVGGASGSVKVERKADGETVFHGRRRLAIGVELVELEFDREGAFRGFKPQGHPVRTRDGGERALVGPPDGDAFIRVEGEPVRDEPPQSGDRGAERA